MTTGQAKPVGYHLAEIPRGVYGDASKIAEELAEFLDALDQKAEVMAIMEAADLIGAIQGWLDAHHPTLSINDLQRMSEITERVFKNGLRA